MKQSKLDKRFFKVVEFLDVFKNFCEYRDIFKVKFGYHETVISIFDIDYDIESRTIKIYTEQISYDSKDILHTRFSFKEFRYWFMSNVKFTLPENNYVDLTDIDFVSEFLEEYKQSKEPQFNFSNHSILELKCRNNYINNCIK